LKPNLSAGPDGLPDDDDDDSSSLFCFSFHI